MCNQVFYAIYSPISFVLLFFHPFYTLQPCTFNFTFNPSFSNSSSWHIPGRNFTSCGSQNLHFMGPKKYIVCLIPFNRGWFESRKTPHHMPVCLIPFTRRKIQAKKCLKSEKKLPYSTGMPRQSKFCQKFGKNKPSKDYIIDNQI